MASESVVLSTNPVTERSFSCQCVIRLKSLKEPSEKKKEKSVVRSFTFYGFFPLRFPLLIRFHTDKKHAESAVVKEAYLTKHVWLEKRKEWEKRVGKNGVLGQGCVLLCLACRKTSLWVLSEAARPYELGGSLHLTVH